MNDSKNSLFFKQGFKIKFNRDTDPLFIFFDYDIRSYPVNMNIQHFHNFYEIFIPLETSTGHLIDGEYNQLNSYDMVLLKPGLLHKSVYPKVNMPQKRIIINFNLGEGIPGLEYELKKLLDIFSLELPIIRFPANIMTEIVQKINDIFQIGKQKHDRWQIAYYAEFIELLWLINKNINLNCYNQDRAIDSNAQKIYYVMDYINHHYSENVSLESVADQHAISPFYLSHIFKDITGINFVSYVQTVRIRNALQMLAYSNNTVSEIIEKCGFTSTSQFNRVFHKFCGISPSDYRKSHTVKKNVLIGVMDPEKEEVAPAAFPPRLSIKGIKKTHQGGNMKVGVRAHDFGSTIPINLKAKLKEYNAETIQLALHKSFPYMRSYLEVTYEDIEDIKNQGFDISVLGCYIDIAAQNDSKWNNQLTQFEAALRIAKELGAKCVATETSDCTDEDREVQFERVVEALEHLLPIAKKYDVPIAIEPVIRHTINTPDMVSRLLERLNNDEYLKLLFDPVNLLRDDLANNTFSFFEEYISKYEKKFVAMHVKDIIEGERVPLGTGVMAKIYPHIARVLTVDIPLIREELPVDSLKEDLAFIRKTFCGQQVEETT